MSPRQRKRIARRPMRSTLVFLVGLGVWACGPDDERLTSPSVEASRFSAGGGQQPELDSALAVHRRHTLRLIAIPGVVGTAVGFTRDRRPAIKILTKASGVTGLPGSLEGIPVEVEVTGEFFANNCDPSNCGNTGQWPVPVPIGVSTGNVDQCEAGTIGARVIAGIHVYALSNNHVLALENGAPLGSNVVQPGLFETGCSTQGTTVLGVLVSFVPIQFCSGGNCPSNTMDAAIASSNAANLGNATPPQGYWWPSSTVQTATVGLGVKKYGRTTSVSSGQVTGIDATVTVSYSSGPAQFIHQILISNCPGACSGRGDSGSLWVTNDASANPVGLLFAGSSDGSIAWANRIGDVLTNFGVTIDNTPHLTASGGLAAYCDINCGAGGFPWIVSVTASGNTITVTDDASPANTGTITLSSGTASGGLTASCNNGCNGAPAFPAILSMIASGHTITLRDSDGNTGTITLSGITLSGGLTASCPSGFCGGSPWPVITAVKALGANGLSDGFAVLDNGSNSAYVQLSN